jgi:hypothetical protein
MDLFTLYIIYIMCCHYHFLVIQTEHNLRLLMDDQYFPIIEVYNNIEIFKFNFIKVGINAWIPSKVK